MPERDTPPTPLSLALLMALAEEPMHGYALMQAVEEQTEGVLTPGTGTLYAALDRLMESGLIADAEEDSDDRRRGRTYAITREGREMAREEIARLQRIVALAHERDLAPGKAG